MLRFGILGMSEGNGHPYSWSAICNGYDPRHMASCPFPTIPDYLSAQTWPEAKIENVQVTHIWTQHLSTSNHIALASNIDTVVEHAEEMLDKVDAILLARDDAENHPIMAKPFLQAGLPVFIDKPFALTREDAETMLNQQQFDAQIFTCSSLRFAQELYLTDSELLAVGEIKWVEASVMKRWETYAVHVIEPIVSQLKKRGDLIEVKTCKVKDVHLSIIEWQNLLAYVKVTGRNPVPLSITFHGDRGAVTKVFRDSFTCFKASLQNFIKQIETRQQMVDRNETWEITEILEWGRM